MNNIEFKNLDLSLVKPLVSFQKKFVDELNGNIFIEQEIIRNLNSKYFYSHLCLTNNLVSGFIIAQRVLNIFEIYSLFVAPDSRRLGIAMTLLNDLIKMCKKQRIEKILLEVVEINKAAKNLYLKNDFEIYAERKNYYKKDNKKINAKLMRLRLR
ncbi:MAG: GNAT family N-acetyltransferase [Alphaproteobacteria bacterium]